MLKCNFFLFISEKQIPDKEALKKIFFVYTLSKRKIISKLLEFNDWNRTPKIIIYESLNQFFDSSNTPNDTLIEQYSFFISYIHSFVDVFSNKHNQKCFSIISIDQNNSIKINKIQQTLIELYFYKKNCYLQGDDIPKKLNQILFVQK